MMTIHLCLRKQELHASLTKDDLVFEEWEGRATVRLATDYLSKNCPGGLHAREFGMAGRITAPEAP